jgi:RNA polymerase II transcription mediator complex subunit 9
MATPRHARTPSNAQTPAPEAEEDVAHLPPPNTFDFIPPLHALLSRLLLPSAGIAHGDGTAGAGEDAAALSGPGHLDIQQLGAASSGIKVKIQKARNAVKDMPDVDRSIEDQEEEIEALEERIAKMRAMLGNLGKHRGETEDVDMSEG